MRPVVLYTLLSLDGDATAPDEFVQDWDGQLDANLAQVIGEQDAVLLGRQMYDEWSQHWPSSDSEPFASFINSVRKYAFTAGEVARDWAATSVVAGPAEDFVADLKQGEGGGIGIHGSLTLARSLLRADLVDVLRLAVFPTTTGGGSRPFDGTGLRRWRLVDSASTPTGALLLHYERRAR